MILIDAWVAFPQKINLGNAIESTFKYKFMQRKKKQTFLISFLMAIAIHHRKILKGWAYQLSDVPTAQKNKFTSKRHWIRKVSFASFSFCAFDIIKRSYITSLGIFYASFLSGFG